MLTENVPTNSTTEEVTQTETKLIRQGYFGNGRPGPGRPKGSVDYISREVRAAARAIVDDPEYRTLLIARLKVGEAPHMETLLWHYAYGKPKETIEVEGNITVEKIVREVIHTTPQDVIDVTATEDAVR
jgi:hypothetical protein